MPEQPSAGADGGPVPSAVAALARDRGLSEPRPLAAGLEFAAYRARSADGVELVLRTPLGPRHQSNANDPVVDLRATMAWEYAVTRYVGRHAIPVAAPVALVTGPPDVMISTYVDDDGGGADQYALGRLLRRLHALPPPPLRPVAAEGLDVARLLPTRIARRWAFLAEVHPELPPPLPADGLTAVLTRCPGRSLLHLDVRSANLRCVGGAVRAVLDWSNALVGDPELELARVAEYARLGNGLDAGAVRAGYDVPAGRRPVAERVYRLDAAVMLAVVFSLEAPDPVLAARTVERVVELSERLRRDFDRDR